MNCSENSINLHNLKSNGWDKEGHVDGISRSRGWDKEIPHRVLPMEQLVLSDKWVRKKYLTWVKTKENPIWCARKTMLRM